MKKSYKKIKTVLVQLLMGLFLGLFLGGFLVSMFELERFGIDIMIYFLIMAVVAYILQIIIHEGGHCLFGLLNGFEFISFRIGSYMWVKDHGKIKFKRYQLTGTGGQCLMEPTQPDLKAYCLYCAGGGICNLLATLIFLILGILFGDMLFRIFCFCMIGLGLLTGLLNLIPIDAEVPNDGYNIYCMLKEKESVQSIYQQLMLAKEFADGKRWNEIDGKLFELYEGADLTNPLNTCIEANKGSRLLALKKYDEAKECLENLYQKDISMIYRSCVIYDLVLIELLTSQDINVDKYLDEKMKKRMNGDKSDISSLLDQYGIDLLVNKDEEQAKVDLKYFNDACKTHPYEGIVEDTKEFVKLLEERKM